MTAGGVRAGANSAAECVGFDAGNAAFRERRQGREKLGVRFALAKASGRMLPDSICFWISPGSGAIDRSIAAGQELGRQRRKPLERHMQHVEAGLELEQFGGEMARPSRGRSVPNVRAPGLALASADQLPETCCRQILPHHQHVRHDGDAGDRRKILHRVVRTVLDQALIDGMGLAGAEDQRVAVGLGTRHRVGADDARSAGAVLDHDRLPQLGCRLLRDQARHDVDRPAGRVGHDDGDGAARKTLRASGQGEAKHGKPGERGAAGQHRLALLFTSGPDAKSRPPGRAPQAVRPARRRPPGCSGSRLASHSSSR